MTDPLVSGQSVPPTTAGEVAELVAWLRAFGDEQLGLHREDPDAYRFTRTADLLERQQPQPVPVSERLPGVEGEKHPDAIRMDALCDQSWDLRCFDMPTGEGDADVRWS